MTFQITEINVDLRQYFEYDIAKLTAALRNKQLIFNEQADNNELQAEIINLEHQINRYHAYLTPPPYYLVNYPDNPRATAAEIAKQVSINQHDLLEMPGGNNQGSVLLTKTLYYYLTSPIAVCSYSKLPGVLAVHHQQGITLGNLQHVALLSAEQTGLAIQRFANNSSLIKLSKSLPATPATPATPANPYCPYSILKAKCSDKLYALYRGKKFLLGNGVYGRAKLGQELASAKFVAIKIILSQFNKNDPNEIAVLKKINKLYGEQTRAGRWIKEDHNKKRTYYQYKHYIITEYGGINLQTYLDLNCNITTKEKLTLLLKVITELKQLHQLRIIHGDLKLTNILYDLDTSTIQLIDYGLSAIIPDNQDYCLAYPIHVKPKCEYLPYEITIIDPFYGLGQYAKITTSVDIYALGYLIANKNYGFNLSNFSNALTELLNRMQQRNVPKLRPNIAEVEEVVKSELAKLTEIYPKHFKLRRGTDEDEQRSIKNSM